MSELYNVTSSPHIRAKDSTQRIMLYVIIALLPATVFGIINFGPRALAVVVVSIASCLVSEYLYNKIAHKKQLCRYRFTSRPEPVPHRSVLHSNHRWCICHCCCKNDFWRTWTELHEPGTWCSMLPAPCIYRSYDKLHI